MLTKEDLQRYDRQIKYEGFGEEGQRRLKASHVIVAGAGGLGCPASVYLACAGVGQITIIDNEAVELSNLNRQNCTGTRTSGRGRPFPLQVS